MEDGSHLTLLCETRRGYSNLCRLITRAHAGTQATGRAPTCPASGDHLRRPRGARAGAGLPLGLRPRGRGGPGGGAGRPRRGGRGRPAPAADFGPDHLRIELQRPFARNDRRRNRRLAELAGRLGVPAVATGNVHAHSRARTRLQDALVAVRLGKTLDECEPERRGNSSHALAPPEAMAERFADHPGAVAETGRLAERLRFDLTSDLGYAYPGAGGSRGGREARRGLRTPARRALPARGGPRPGGGPPGRGAAGDPPSRPLGLLRPAPRPARARARGGGRGEGLGTRCAPRCRRGGGGARAWPRSSATSPASRTSTRCTTSCTWGASSTRT